MNSRLTFGLVILLLAGIIFSCKDDNTAERLRKIELEKLANFVEEHNIQDYKKSSGLYFIPKVVGTGDTIKVGDRVQIFYATWLIDSTLIDETSGYLAGHRYEPYEFIVGAGNAITGLEEAVTYMQKGAKAGLVIPSELAYGQNGTYGVNGFTTILMEVEIYKFYPASQ